MDKGGGRGGGYNSSRRKLYIYLGRKAGHYAGGMADGGQAVAGKKNGLIRIQKAGKVSPNFWQKSDHS